MFQIGAGELVGHKIAFFDADPVLAGQYSPHGQRQFEDFSASRGYLLIRARLARVIGHERMQVAVTGVENVKNHEIATISDLINRLKHLDKL